MTQVLLVGNPNCGKTTLFNALTGENQRVGNWPGVTVEKKTGSFVFNQKTFGLIDLPGVYSLVSSENSSSVDEQITARAVAEEPADIIVNVVDACHLERHLYLTSQLMELGKPVLIALSMTDLAKKQGLSIDKEALSLALNCPVIEIQALQRHGIDELAARLSAKIEPAKPMPLKFDKELQQTFNTLKSALETQKSPVTNPFFAAHRILEGDTLLYQCPEFLKPVITDTDILMADARYQAIHQAVLNVQHSDNERLEHFTAKIDKVMLHRYLGVPIFVAVMYAMFFFAINVGGVFQDFFDLSSAAIFVQGTVKVMSALQAPSWLIALMAHGLGKGINTVLTFIPVIGAMFFFLAFLELSGYMARAAFVVDKLMRLLGLPGKSFVPMIVGFGCNVPAILATRTIHSERDRLLTILMTPFMSCSARLAIYAVFVAAFFPTGGQNIVFSLYLIGILMAVITGFLFRKTLLKGDSSPLVIELPAYHRPKFARLLQESALRIKHFVYRAGKLIVPACVVLAGLNAWSISGSGSPSVLAWIGQQMTPLFHPMGITPENWPATVGLLTGVLAKEVVVGTLNTLYSQMSGALQVETLDLGIIASLKLAFYSIGDNIFHLGEMLLHPFSAIRTDGEISRSVYGSITQMFDGKIGAYAYLLFILLYIPCVSTIAVIRKEANAFLMGLSVAWSIFVAYAAAVVFYQLATCFHHPWLTVKWIVIMLALTTAWVMVLLQMSHRLGKRYVIASS